MKIPMQQMYQQRKEFIIVALTGIAGSGCGEFADIMSKPFSEWEGQLRPTSKIEDMREGDKREMVFQREYDLCYHVCEKQYEPFNVIKYENVLLLYTLEYLAKKCNQNDQIRNELAAITKQKFDKSHELKTDIEEIDYVVDNNISVDELMTFGMTDKLCDKVREVVMLNKPKTKKDYRKGLYNIFVSDMFAKFCTRFLGELKHRDYYATKFFNHRLATCIRATGDPTKVMRHKGKIQGNDHVFDVVEKINILIKGYHEAQQNKGRRFVIDSVCNSMEVLYLRERYNAFYMIALHNDGKEEDLIRETVCRTTYDKGYEEAVEKEKAGVMRLTSKIMKLSEIESGLKDFEKGQFLVLIFRVASQKVKYT